jgi:predicted MPP superfamily phosphohydrolase
VSRRRPLSPLLTGLGGLAALAGSFVVWHSRTRAPYQPRLERVTLPLPCGYEGLAGLRIAFVSDTHVGPTFSPDDLKGNLAALFAERLDLVLLGGDFASESPRYATGAAAVLGELAARASLGGFAVLGNHDYAVSRAKIAAALTEAGVRVLRNEAVEVSAGRGSLWVVGIDDALLGKPDPEAAFAPVPAGAAALALWHEPDWAADAAARGAFAQLSGHSHGGQIRFPVVGPLVLPPGGRRYVIGDYLVDGMPLHVSRGVGVYKPPLRFRCPPELTLVELASAECR